MTRPPRLPLLAAALMFLAVSAQAAKAALEKRYGAEYLMSTIRLDSP